MCRERLYTGEKKQNDGWWFVSTVFLRAATRHHFFSLSLWIFILFHFYFAKIIRQKWIWRGNTLFRSYTQPNQINRFFLLSVKGSPSSAVFFILSFLDYIMDYYASPNVRYHTDQELLYIIHMMTDYPPLAGEMEREKRWILFSSVDWKEMNVFLLERKQKQQNDVIDFFSFTCLVIVRFRYRLDYV